MELRYNGFVFAPSNESSFSIYGNKHLSVSSAKEPALKIIDKRIGPATTLGNVLPGGWFAANGSIYFVPKVLPYPTQPGYTYVVCVGDDGVAFAMKNNTPVEPVDVELVVT